MDHQMFSQVVRALLAGKIICHDTFPREFVFLHDEVNRRDVGDYLLKIERSIHATSDGKGFYCAYLDMSDAEAKLSVRRLFSQMAGEIEPLVRWLSLAKSCSPDGRPIESGSLVKESELLGFIESSPELNQSLEDLTKHKLFKSTATDGKGRISQILNKLVELGYLVRLDKTGSLYQATARWSYLYDVLTFIRSHERLGEDDEHSASQGNLI